jgi:S1-C subfamily serine protease
VPTLIAEGEYDYPYLGATFASELSLAEQSQYGLAQNEGAYLVGVTPGGPADDAGLIAANRTSGRGGDLVIAVDGQSVADFADLNSYLVFHTKVGQTVELTVLRNGETIRVPLTLGERP